MTGRNLFHLTPGQRSNNVDQWGPRSASWRLTALAGVGLLTLGAYGLARPRAAAEVFGMPLRDPEEPRSWRPKAARDLTTGMMTLALLALRDRRAVGTYAVACALIPALDALLVVRNGSRKPWQVAMHGGTAGLMLALVIALLREA